MSTKAKIVFASLSLILGLGIYYGTGDAKYRSFAKVSEHKKEVPSSTQGHLDIPFNSDQSFAIQIDEHQSDSDVHNTDNQATNDYAANNEQYPQETLSESSNQSLAGTETTVVNDTEPFMLDSKVNGKPEINQEVQQAIQATIDQWQWSVDVPVRESLNLSGLFEDPENDLLSVRIELKVAGLTITGYPLIHIAGIPVATPSGYLVVKATDNQRSEDDTTWVSAQFRLPIISNDLQTSSPLEGDTLYRLETTNNLAGMYTPYEVVYCQAFKFVKQQVYFAAANNKTRCPNEEQLELVGRYEVTPDQQLVITSDRSSFDAKQIWRLKKQYTSVQQPAATNYFVTVDNGRQNESYTMQKDKRAMEAHINGVTGKHAFQGQWFDFLLPVSNEQYLMASYSNYIYDYQTEIAGQGGETTDSDLNLNAQAFSLSCDQIAPMFESGVLAGPGKYGIDIISTNYPTNLAYALDCFEYVSNPQTGQRSLSFDLAYSPYEEFLPGEIYSYVLRPKPRYAAQLEEIKLNLIYAAPN